MDTKHLVENAKGLIGTDPKLNLTLKPFFEVLNFVVEEPYRGACHAASSVLYVLFSELNIESSICIGELGRDQICFDHSWLEIEGKIFDVAVARPLEPKFDGPPVFKSR